MDSKSKRQKVLILHDEVDEPLAKGLLSYLGSVVKGVIFLRRNARWSCNPDMYTQVIRLNEVECFDDINLDRPNVWPVKTQSYEQALEKTYHVRLSKKEHYNKQAKAVAEKLKSRF